MKNSLSLRNMTLFIIFIALILLLSSALYFKSKPKNNLSHISIDVNKLENSNSSSVRSSNTNSLKTEKTFKLSSVLDPNRTLTQDIFKGKVTVLNVWASWCRPCRNEIDDLLVLAKYPGVFWVGLNLNDDLMEAQKILTIYGNPYHENLYDREGRLAIHFGIRGTPELFVLDKHGKVQYRHRGPVNETIWKQDIWPIIQNLQEQPC